MHKAEQPVQHCENYIRRSGFTPNKNSDRIKLLLETAIETGLLVLPRGNQFHIYYGGGKILEVNPQSLSFDVKYLKRKKRQDVTMHFLISKEGKKEGKLNIEEILNNPAGYFAEAKSIMDGWFEENSKQERADQEQIALHNKKAEDGHLAVVDIEFAVSFNANYYNRKYIDNQRKADGKAPYLRYPNPRFDIIAIDQTGQIHVYELKTGLGALGNVKKHLDDFNALIGSEESGDDPNNKEKRYESFLKEVKDIIEIERELLGRDLPNVDTKNKPIFHFAFVENPKENSANQFEEFKSTILKEIGDKVDTIQISRDNYKLNLK